MGIEPILGDVMEPATLAPLPEAETCLYAVGFDRSGGHDKRAVYVSGLRYALTAIGSRIDHLIYISSTSVYGQDAGEWVDENSLCVPISEGGRICLDAEQVVRETVALHRGEIRATILRLAGIYGPGRLIGRADQLHRREPLSGRPDAWLNLIHVDDAVQAVVQLAQSAANPELLLLADEHPLQRQEFYGRLAELLGAPSPVFAPTTETSLNKRCDSSLIRRELPLQLRYPEAVEGLRVEG